MKILYLSCHSILEYDEVKLFNELGHEVFSVGAYTNPARPETDMRPLIPNGYYNEELAALPPPKTLWGEINDRLIDWADVIIATQHVWIFNNWDKMKHKPVVYRTIGQTVAKDEAMVSKYKAGGLKIVRWSPAERLIPNYAGEDAVIRAYKDPEEWGGWVGNRQQVITVGQAMLRRDSHMKFNIFEKVTRGLSRKLYGPENADAGKLWGGHLSYEDLKRTLRESRCYFYTCTDPASYVLSFVEAWMTGCPIVAIGRLLADYTWLETSGLIENGVDGFVSDNLIELRNYVKRVLEDHDLAKKISAKGRMKAIDLFGKDRIKQKWKDFLSYLYAEF